MQARLGRDAPPFERLLAGLLALGALLGCARGAATERSASRSVPVLVELFTSEGCSSCPPADAVLQRLVDAQPVEGARVIALGEHVDYWDDLGWKDRFSSPAFTGRQLGYVRRLGVSAPYTPQLVVAGRMHLLGSDARGARDAITAASRLSGGTLDLATTSLPGGRVELEVRASWAAATDAQVFVAVVQDRATTTVLRGENARRSLTHVAVARSLQAIGAGRGAFSGRTTLVVAPELASAHAVVFVQERGSGPVLAVASVSLPAAAD